MEYEQLQFKLEVFEGPMELLLHLLDKNKVDIMDIPISDILEQYLIYVNEYKKYDLDNISEFLVIASQLVLIKSRMLLPKSDTDEQDPRDELINMIEEYKKYKQVAQTLKEYKENNGDKLFVKDAEDVELDKKYTKVHPVSLLVNAYEGVYKKNMRKMPPSIEAFSGIVGHKIVSVTTKVMAILRSLISNKKVSFKKLMYAQKSRSEIVAAFLAVLELSKVKRIIISDSKTDSQDITLELVRGDESGD